ncbi:hypothetical protein CEXT_804141 [Caerostris extrusa]|uniref:Uncharacterized protein n=1 Tax=Caerostris extrusa TaxID=172846 RepID=A0AAV4N5M6_CAEEX|nr:hypothetical protein CEXT_804141 [Caerostris extrusa]
MWLFVFLDCEGSICNAKIERDARKIHIKDVAGAMDAIQSSEVLFTKMGIFTQTPRIGRKLEAFLEFVLFPPPTEPNGRTSLIYRSIIPTAAIDADVLGFQPGSVIITSVLWLLFIEWVPLFQQ